jgi:hypothetical protein
MDNTPSIALNETTKSKTGLTVVMGQYYWGSGATLDEAKKRFRSMGGRLSQGYGIYVFDADTEFLYVDQMGRITYYGNPPTETIVKARKPKTK